MVNDDTKGPTMSTNPEIGHSITTGDIVTNYHDVGTGTPLLLLHGSGPGVSAWANWRLVIDQLQDRYRIIAPDLAGFGYSEVPDGIEYTRERWLTQIVDLLDALELDTVDVVGNSFGGSMALALTIDHPQRVRRQILMGSVGVPFKITDGLDEVWGYTPDVAKMGELMRNTFAYNADMITDDMVQLRYEASKRPGSREAYESMFPAPRQRWVDAMSHDFADIRGIEQPTLMVHGRDDKVIPLSTSLTLHDLIVDSRMHVFGRCGHWTQIEHTDAFCRVVDDFLSA